MKYVQLFGVFVVLLLMVGSVDAAAQIRGPNGSVDPGSADTVTIDIAGVEEVNLIAFDLAYDSAVTTIVNSRMSDRFSDASLIHQDQDSLAHFAIFCSGNSITVDEWTPIVEITIESTASAGSSEIILTNAHYVKGFEQYDFDSILTAPTHTSSDSSGTSSPQETSPGTIKPPTQPVPSDTYTMDISGAEPSHQEPSPEQSSSNILGGILALGFVGATIMILRKVE